MGDRCHSFDNSHEFPSEKLNRGKIAAFCHLNIEPVTVLLLEIPDVLRNRFAWLSNCR